MNKIYTAGYQEIKSPALLRQMARERGAVVVDIRFKPLSSQPEWNRSSSERYFPPLTYYSLPNFGNVNYKSGGPIRLAAPGTGLTELKPILARNPVILLCCCYEVESCHRRVVADELAKRLDVEIEHLHLESPITSGWKALSLQQPWATLMVRGYKLIENRDWRRSFRGPVLVHASKTFDEEAFTILSSGQIIPRITGLPLARGKTLPFCKEDLHFGGIIGMFTITDCVSQSDDPWFFGKYGYVVKNPRELPFVPMRGQLGFFSVPEEVVKQLDLVGVAK